MAMRRLGTFEHSGRSFKDRRVLTGEIPGMVDGYVEGGPR